MNDRGDEIQIGIRTTAPTHRILQYLEKAEQPAFYVTEACKFF